MSADNSKNNLVIESALRAIEIESAAISALKDRIGSEFEQACSIILNCPGRVVVTGMGKSGHIGKKIAATLASTGTPAMYLVSTYCCFCSVWNIWHKGYRKSLWRVCCYF